MAETDCTVGELIRLLKAFPEDKPVKIMGYYSIMETDEPEEIHDVTYLVEVDPDTFEITDTIEDFVAIVTEKHFEIATEVP